MNKNCKRCQKLITCTPDDISNCDCSKITVSNKTIDFLKTTTWECLCNDCLLHFDELARKNEALSMPKYGEKLVEGIHFYMENQNFVFTETYHFLRGYCCKSGCRHCVYGYKK